MHHARMGHGPPPAGGDATRRGRRPARAQGIWWGARCYIRAAFSSSFFFRKQSMVGVMPFFLSVATSEMYPDSPSTGISNVTGAGDGRRHHSAALFHLPSFFPFFLFCEEFHLPSRVTAWVGRSSCSCILPPGSSRVKSKSLGCVGWVLGWPSPQPSLLEELRPCLV